MKNENFLGFGIYFLGFSTTDQDRLAAGVGGYEIGRVDGFMWPDRSLRNRWVPEYNPAFSGTTGRARESTVGGNGAINGYDGLGEGRGPFSLIRATPISAVSGSSLAVLAEGSGWVYQSQLNI